MDIEFSWRCALSSCSDIYSVLKATARPDKCFLSIFYLASYGKSARVDLPASLNQQGFHSQDAESKMSLYVLLPKSEKKRHFKKRLNFVND